MNSWIFVSLVAIPTWFLLGSFLLLWATGSIFPIPDSREREAHSENVDSKPIFQGCRRPFPGPGTPDIDQA